MTILFRLARGRDTLVAMLPLRTVSEANVREHWSKRHRRASPHRTFTALAIRQSVRPLGLPVVVTLTRLASRRLDDDNLRGALKAVRDGVADALGLRDDSDPRVRWQYSQRSAPRGDYGVEITVVRTIVIPDWDAPAQSASSSSSSSSLAK